MDARAESVLGMDDLSELRASLLRLRRENEDDLAEARATLATLTADHTMGSGSLREVVGNAEYMIEDATTIIALVDAALARMADGTYGICTVCGQPMTPARLQLRPYGLTCVPCSA